jgi:hypothetical protein
MDKAKCPSCGAKSVIDGDCLSFRADKASRFEPDHLRWFQVRLLRGIPLSGGFDACLACGLIWSRVSPEDLEQIIRDHGTDEARGLLNPQDDV